MFNNNFVKFVYNDIKFGFNNGNNEHYNTIFSNPNINIGFVKKLHYKMNLKVKWSLLSKNPGITLHDIETNLDLPWEWKYVSSNPNLTIDFIKKHIDNPWDWYNISTNHNIQINDVENNLDLPWRFRFLSSNPSLTIDFVKKHINDIWFWELISQNPNITLQDIENNLNLPWRWLYIKHTSNKIIQYLQQNRNKINIPDNVVMYDMQTKVNYKILLALYKENFLKTAVGKTFQYVPFSLDFIKDHLDWDWDWHSLSHSEHIKQCDIENNMHLPWVWDFVLYNPNLTIDFLKKLTTILPEDYFKSNKLKPFKYKNITMQDIENNINMNWCFNYVYLNKNVTCEFIVKHNIKGYRYEYIEYNYFKNLPKLKKQYAKLLSGDLLEIKLEGIFIECKTLFDLCMHEFKLKIDDFKKLNVKKGNYQDTWLL